MKWWMAMILAATSVAAPMPATKTTLVSDELEIQDNGARTVFRGHVVLKRDLQTLHADRMVRFGQNGPIEATGNVRGVGKGEKGEVLEVFGSKARYEPSEEVINIWGRPRVRLLVSDPQGKADFESDTAWLDVATKDAKLLTRVKGRITPVPK